MCSSETIIGENELKIDVESAEPEVAEEHASEDEEDCEGYFLEPSPCSVNIAERIAEANRALYDDATSAEYSGERPRRVQFSEQLVDYEPQGYCTDDGFVESGDATSNSEEEIERKDDEDDEKLNKRLNRPKTANKELKLSQPEPPQEDEEEEEEAEAREQETKDGAESDDMDEDVVVSPFNGYGERREEGESGEGGEGGQSKLLLVLLPREQSSSCESVIGEDISQDERKDDEAEEAEVREEVTRNEVTVHSEESKAKRRPKSAGDHLKNRKKHAPKKNCKLSKISPDLNYSYEVETKKVAHQKQRLRKREEKTKENRGTREGCAVEEETRNGKVNIQNIELPKRQDVLRNHNARPKSCYARERDPCPVCPTRPRTAPVRQCCGVRTNLPRYDGLRSEYGLSAQQLQERRRKTFEIKQQRKLELMSKKQEEIQKRIENEEKFEEWLNSKSRGSRRGAAVRRVKGDTLTRSDVYIQSHAVYATKRGVSYSVDYSLGGASGGRGGRLSLGEVGRRHDSKEVKTIKLEKLFEDVTPHVKRSYRIYLGVDSNK